MNFIFDFDGTLIDSFECVIGKFALLAQEFHLRALDANEINQLRDLSSREIIKHLQIPIYKIPNIIKKIRLHLQEEMPVLKPFPNIPQVLQKLYDAQFCLGILTSNSKENVELWLKSHDLQHLFKFIHVESRLWGKNRVLKKTLKMFKMDLAQTFFIGDETRDIEAAMECNVHTVAVTWGYNSEKILAQCEPHYLIHKPEELLVLSGLAEEIV